MRSERAMPRMITLHAPATLWSSTSNSTRFVDRRADQLGALRGAEQHGAALHDVVDREDVGLTVGVGDQPAQRQAAQQIPALVHRQDLHPSSVTGIASSFSAPVVLSRNESLPQ
ncbi:hypothetical protein MLM_3278 [Mycobacterium lepraemurium]|nr:hypothetical protein MLM_3278 [Mycobacterium lepraemurium]